MSGGNSLAIHWTVWFSMKHTCVSPSEGSTVKDFNGNKFVVIDAVESENYPSEVILKYYDEKIVRLKKWNGPTWA